MARLTEPLKRGQEKDSAVISAAAARELADTTKSVRKHCFKFIQEEAKEGRTELYFGIYAVSEKQVNSLKTELINLGYSVTQDEVDSQTLIIKW